MLGTAWDVTEEIIQSLKRFYCAMYAGGEESDINKLRYKIYCAKRGTLESDQLSPCKQSLLKHIERANYQTRIWRMSLSNYTDNPSPNGHGWCWQKLMMNNVLKLIGLIANLHLRR